ncbi:hypothetical protein POM88_031129 [Heracleum sosnowskyi]|uniref:Uncharacterized protein n=1 Tax=Heracleum sosnowskyi TaxID=360622 RepID=A0AAD8HY85_9APIA|nr:hypothetical protein POM88_031129 [Heracleum sosnowskyi]
MPERGTIVPAGSKVQLSANHRLVLSDSQGKTYDENLIILGSDSTKVRDSFSNPSDTLSTTQIMDNGSLLYSKHSESNFSSGRFQLRINLLHKMATMSVGLMILQTPVIPVCR